MTLFQVKRSLNIMKGKNTVDRIKTATKREKGEDK